MIKKIYLSLIFITAALLFGALPACALYWGVLKEFEDKPQRFAMYKILNDIPIKYHIMEVDAEDEYEKTKSGMNKKQIEIQNHLNQNLAAQKRMAELEKIINNAFNLWFEDTKNMIINDGREKEFEDILEITNDVLKNGIKFQKVPEIKQADIFFFFTSSEGMRFNCGNFAACLKFTNPIEIVAVNPFSKGNLLTKVINKNFPIFKALIHEIGHYYGLTDQYKDTGHDSLEHSTFNRMNTKDAVMGANREDSLSCDDVDGFINLIDLTLSLDDGEFSDRAQKGWASFCNGKKNKKGKYYKDEFYKNAQLRNKEPYNNGKTTTYFDEEGSWTYSNLNGY